MAKLKDIKITEAQLTAIVNCVDNLSGMRGGWDSQTDKEISHDIKMVDRFLNNNGYKRKFT